MALSKATRASAFSLSSRRRSSSVGRIRVDQKLGLNGVAARLLICELNRLRRRLTICAARSRDDWPSWVAWRSSSSRAFFCRVRGLALGGEAFRLVGLRRADHFQLIVEPLDVGHPQREQGVGLALDLQRALAQLGEEVVAGVGGDALADQVELRVELVEAGVLGQGGRRFRSTAACGAGLAAQASLPRLRSRPRAMANWQSNICRLARLIESPFDPDWLKQYGPARAPSNSPRR